mgnify:CR=1 FL=1
MIKKSISLTAEGKKELEAELKALIAERPAIAERIATARSFGDLSENEEYSSARSEQKVAEGRILEIQEILKNAKVAVFGIGGVGSYVVEGLVRAGIGKLIIFDFDKVDITNILFSGNRQNLLSEKIYIALMKYISSKYPEQESSLKRDIVLSIIIQGCFHAYQIFANDGNRDEVTAILGEVGTCLKNNFL